MLSYILAVTGLDKLEFTGHKTYFNTNLAILDATFLTVVNLIFLPPVRSHFRTQFPQNHRQNLKKAKHARKVSLFYKLRGELHKSTSKGQFVYHSQ